MPSLLDDKYPTGHLEASKNEHEDTHLAVELPISLQGLSAEELADIDKKVT